LRLLPGGAAQSLNGSNEVVPDLLVLGTRIFSPLKQAITIADHPDWSHRSVKCRPSGPQELFFVGRVLRRSHELIIRGLRLLPGGAAQSLNGSNEVVPDLLVLGTRIFIPQSAVVCQPQVARCRRIVVGSRCGKGGPASNQPSANSYTAESDQKDLHCTPGSLSLLAVPERKSVVGLDVKLGHVGCEFHIVPLFQ